jgi:hypothetical protein
MVEGLGVRAILVPYDSGHRDARMGRGPEHLLANGLSGALSPNRNEVHQVVVESESILPAEVATAFELDRLVSEDPACDPLLRKAIRGKNVGDTVRLTIIRNGQERQVTVSLEEFPGS